MQINKEQVNALILQGQKKGLTGKDVIDALIRKGYEPEGVNVPAIKETMAKKVAPTETKEPGFVEGLKTDLNTRVDRVGAIQSRTDSSGLEKAVQTFGQGAGLAANAIEKTAEQIPGVKQAFGAIGSGINWLATSDFSPVKMLGNEIGESKALQEVTQLYDTDQNFKDSVDAVANIARLGGDVQMAADAVNFTKNVTSKITDKVKTLGTKTPPPDGGTTPLLSPEGQAMVDKVVPDSATIMNRVARLKPTDANAFKKLAGETHGDYLAKTSNFGTPDQIITKEATKFTQSLNSVDDALARLPGEFKNGAVSDALEGLVERAKGTSGTNTKSPFLDRALELENKHTSQGLNMSEINEVKRLFEREVKLGYNKLINGDKVAQATNIDNALRKWQVKQAQDLGFENIAELNKQTQLSKFIVDKLGGQFIGQSGLNGVNLTDWIMLSGGNPTAIGGFLVKKFFSSKGIQAKIAEFLNKGEIRGQIEPKITPSKQPTQQQSKIKVKKALSKTIPPKSLKAKGEIPPTREITPDFKLTGQDAKVQNASIAKYKANPKKLTKDYLKANGKVVNTDEARKFFKDVGYRGSNSAAVQEASSAVAKDAWQELLKTSKGKDSLIYIGGSGTGKTSAVKNIFPKEIENAGVILDGNLSTMKSAQARIQESLDAGVHPNLIYIYRDPVGSWVEGVVKRMKNTKNGEGGRVVPLSIFVENHIGSYGVAKNLLNSKKNGTIYDFKMVDNSLGKGNQALLERSKFDKIKYKDSLKQELKNKTKELYEQGTITKTEYEALIK